MVNPTGYTALDLIGFTDKGQYDPLANYVRNDIVHDTNEKMWICQVDDTLGIAPVEGVNWTKFIAPPSTNPESIGIGYGSCATAEATTAKEATLSGFALKANGYVSVKFTYNVPAGSTLNVNNTGAKPIYYHGAAIGADLIEAGDIATFVYDGTNYHLLGLDTDSSQIQALANDKVNVSDIANNLTTTTTGKVLDATQGKALDDAKPNKSTLAFVETGSTSSQQIAKGKYVYWNGKLYTANTIISQGATLDSSSNGNLDECTDGGFNELIKFNDISNEFSIGSGITSGTLSGKAYRCGNIVIGEFAITSPTFSSWAGYVINTSISPKSGVIVLTANQSDNTRLAKGITFNNTGFYYANDTKTTPTYSSIIVGFVLYV